MAESSIGFGGVALRFALALVLVLLTYNPGGTSWYHWVTGDLAAFDALKALAGVVLLIGWVVFLTATARSLGAIGVLLATAFFVALVWVAVQYGWFEAAPRTLMWIALFVAAAVLAIGMSWSHLRRRLSGQLDVDEVDSR